MEEHKDPLEHWIVFTTKATRTERFDFLSVSDLYG